MYTFELYNSEGCYPVENLSSSAILKMITDIVEKNPCNSTLKFKREHWGGFWQVVNGKVMAFCEDGSVSFSPWLSELTHNSKDWSVVVAEIVR